MVLLTKKKRSATNTIPLQHHHTINNYQVHTYDHVISALTRSPPSHGSNGNGGEGSGLGLSRMEAAAKTEAIDKVGHAIVIAHSNNNNNHQSTTAASTTTAGRQHNSLVRSFGLLSCLGGVELWRLEQRAEEVILWLTNCFVERSSSSSQASVAAAFELRTLLVDALAKPLTCPDNIATTANSVAPHPTTTAPSPSSTPPPPPLWQAMTRFHPATLEEHVVNVIKKKKQQEEEGVHLMVSDEDDDSGGDSSASGGGGGGGGSDTPSPPSPQSSRVRVIRCLACCPSSTTPVNSKKDKNKNSNSGGSSTSSVSYINVPSSALLLLVLSDPLATSLTRSRLHHLWLR
jgi:hypothetical protein